MLVITRRTSDKISFPQVGVTVHFIRVQGSSAKVGVDAPATLPLFAMRSTAKKSTPLSFASNGYASLAKYGMKFVTSCMH